jgi:two-component system, chemotaxis family, sensor kinase Cph1
MLTAAELSKLTKEELDSLPFGAIRLSSYGTIISYNATEGRLAGRTPERVLGRNFFTEVAPCTNVQEFKGLFIKMIKEQRSVYHEFSFDFDFEPPMHVQITILRDSGDESIWVLVEPS